MKSQVSIAPAPVPMAQPFAAHSIASMFAEKSSIQRGLRCGVQEVECPKRPFQEDDFEGRPILAAPGDGETDIVGMMRLQSIFDQVQKNIGSMSQAQLSAMRKATKSLLKDNFIEIDRRVASLKNAEKARKRARLCNLFQKIGALLLTVAIAAVAIASAPATGVGAAAGVMALLAVGGAMVNLAGGVSAVRNGNDGYSLESLFEGEGCGTGSAALAALCSGDPVGLSVEGATAAAKGLGVGKEGLVIVTAVTTAVVILASIAYYKRDSIKAAVSRLKAFVSSGGKQGAAACKSARKTASGEAAQTELTASSSTADSAAEKTASKSVQALKELQAQLKGMQGLNRMIMILGGMTSGVSAIYGGSVDLEIADEYKDAGDCQSASSLRDASISKIEQDTLQVMELVRNLMKGTQDSFATIKALLDEWTKSMTTLCEVSSRPARMA